MSKVLIRTVLSKDLDECFHVETSGFPPEEAATRETIKLRMETFPQGFLVAELDGRVIGILNSASTDKDDISDEELKQLIGHDPKGRNMVVFALAVLPQYRKQGIARQLMLHFMDEARQNTKEAILLMCKQNLIAYYERLGFTHAGLSKSTHGGAEWHEMRLSFWAERSLNDTTTGTSQFCDERPTPNHRFLCEQTRHGGQVHVG